MPRVESRFAAALAAGSPVVVLSVAASLAGVVGDLSPFDAAADEPVESLSVDESVECSIKTSVTAAAPASTLHDLPSMLRSPAKLPLRTSKRRCRAPSGLRVIVTSARNVCDLGCRGPASSRRRARTASTRGHSAGAVHSRSIGSRGSAAAAVDLHRTNKEISPETSRSGAGGRLLSRANRDVIDVHRGSGRDQTCRPVSHVPLPHGPIANHDVGRIEDLLTVLIQANVTPRCCGSLHI